MNFTEKLQKLRKEKGFTQAELAEKVGVSTRSIQNYELGMRYPKRNILDKLCEILETRIEYLVSSDDFIGLVHAEDGARGVASAQQLLNCAGALFAGGEMSEDDKDKVMLALQNIYWKAKEKNRKYSSKE
ncbi:MAG: helix-turn-helix transcriptional regulator [Ruminiclostridium sp.]|nr:helix-turn-helix transcriptional regulator [Ruminiclostridium sp.]